MGENKDSESQAQSTKKISLLIALIVLILGILCPVMIMVYNNEWLSLTTIQGTIWLYAISPVGSGFQPLMYDFGWVLFLVFRIIPAFQLYRYYSGKTTRKLAYIATFIGDAIYILGGLVILLDAITHPGQFAIPLPFQMIFSILILWKIQGPEPTSPWKDAK